MEEKYIKGIIIATIAVLVGLAFWSTVGSSIGTLAVIQTSTNASFTFPANGSTSDLTTCGQLNTTTITVYNYTNNTGAVGGAGALVGSTNYTVTQAAGTDGYLSARVTCTALATNWVCGYATNVTCNYQPRGYITEGGGRSVALLIPVFLAILIAFAAIPDLREWIGFSK